MNTRVAQDFVVFDETEACPYVPGRIARMPLVVPTRPRDPGEADRRFAAGQRRSGDFVYSTKCPGCEACQPIRLEVERFTPCRSQRRAWRVGQRHFRSEIGPLVSDSSRVELFNRHRQKRGLAREGSIDLDSYAWGLGRSCFEAFEIDYYVAERLAGVAICDRGQVSLSAVYTYYDPDLARLSPGVYSILRQIEFCRSEGLRYLYLGFYVAESRAMAYKARYRPHQRLIGGVWYDLD